MSKPVPPHADFLFVGDWQPIEKCPEKVPVLFKGDSGYGGALATFICNGRKDSEYRPMSPFLDATNTCLEDRGWLPTHFARYMEG